MEGFHYKLFTRHLRIIGLNFDRNNGKQSKYSPKVWFPFILWLTCLIANKAVNDYIVKENTFQVRFKNETKPSIKERVSNLYKFSLFAITLSSSGYEIILWIVCLFKRKQFVDLANGVFALKSRIPQSYDNFEKRIKRNGIFFLLLLVLWFTLEILIFSFVYVVGNTRNLKFVLILTPLQLVILVHRVISCTCVEGLFVFYSLSFADIIRNFNASLKLVMENTEQDAKEMVARMRLTYVRLGNIFLQARSAMSIMLTVGLIFNLLSVMGYILVDNETPIMNSTSLWLVSKAMILFFVNIFRISTIIFYSDIPHNQAMETYRILSTFKINKDASNGAYNELSLFMSMKETYTFRYTACGFCEIRKSLLPTLIGVLITYTVILVQNGSS